MKEKIKTINFHKALRRENLGVIVVALFGLWIGWNSLFVILKNNRLVSEIQTRAEETALLDLENENLELSIEYYKTDEYITQAAREELLLVAPNENVAIAPKTRDAVFTPVSSQEANQDEPKSNFNQWVDFFMGREL